MSTLIPTPHKSALSHTPTHDYIHTEAKFTPTPTATSTPLPTSTPRATATPLPTSSDVGFMDDGQGHRWCELDTVKAGRIVMWRAIGRWPSPEEAQAAVGDSWPPFTADDQPLDVTGLWRSDVEWHTNGPDDPSPGWGFSASVETQLAPGVYNLTSLWLHDLKSCTLTVIE